MKRYARASDIANKLAGDLYRTEAAQDASINRLGRLAQSLTRSRASAGLSATVGQEVFDALATAIRAQVEAQAAVALLHRELESVKATTSFRSVVLGGVEKSEEPVIRPQGRIRLATAA